MKSTLTRRAAVHDGSYSRKLCHVALRRFPHGWAGLHSSGSWTVAAAELTAAAGFWAKYGGAPIVWLWFVCEYVWHFPKGFWRFLKLTSESMQAESGIVPDFEAGDEFQEEPKTYYELKSQPLKNRSVSSLAVNTYFPRWCSAVVMKLQPFSLEYVPGGCDWSRPGSHSTWTGNQLVSHDSFFLAGTELCNTWVLSCQHQLQILAHRGADSSRFNEMLFCLTWNDGSWTCRAV